jgi:hypothetical protein
MGQIFSKKNLQRFCKGFLCLLAALLLEAAADPPPMAFQKPCKEPHYKKPS